MLLSRSKEIKKYNINTIQHLKHDNRRRETSEVIDALYGVP